MGLRLFPLQVHLQALRSHDPDLRANMDIYPLDFAVGQLLCQLLSNSFDFLLLVFPQDSWLTGVGSVDYVDYVHLAWRFCELDTDFYGMYGRFRKVKGDYDSMLWNPFHDIFTLHTACR